MKAFLPSPLWPALSPVSINIGRVKVQMTAIRNDNSQGRVSQQDDGNSVLSQGVGCQMMGEHGAGTPPHPPLLVCLLLLLVGLFPWKWVSSPMGLLQGTDGMVPMSRQEILSRLEQEVFSSYTTHCHCEGAQQA